MAARAGGTIRRLLFPAPTSIPYSCPEFCDTSCALYHHCNPTIPSSPFAPSSFSHEPLISTPIVRRPSNLFPAFPIVAGAVLAAALILLVAFYLHLLIGRRRRRRRTAAALAFANAAAAAPGDGVNDFFDGIEVDHHVWYIRTVGLDESTIGAITSCAYKADDGAPTAECSVCLAEFRDGEVLRRLPKCGHAFHLECIDTWLRSHVNCPLCRAPVVTAAAAGGGVAEGGGGAHYDGDSGPSSFGSSSSSSFSGGSDPVNTNSRSLVPIHSSQRIIWSSESNGEISQTVRMEVRLEIEPRIGS